MRAGAVDAACELTLIPGEFCLIDETLSPIIERKEKTQSTKFDLKWISFHLAVALMRKLSIWSDRQPSIYLVNSLNWTLNWRQAAITSTKRDSIEPTRRVTWPTVPLFPTVGLWWYKKKKRPLHSDNWRAAAAFYKRFQPDQQWLTCCFRFTVTGSFCGGAEGARMFPS